MSFVIVDENSITKVLSAYFIFELQMHQVEMEMQTEELRPARAELDLSQSRYITFFDKVPEGHIMFNEQSLILEANQTTARLLRMSRNALANQTVSHFIPPEDQPIFHLHRKQLFLTQAQSRITSCACGTRIRPPSERG